MFVGATFESDHIHLQIFLGRLRESEMERINERLHHGVVEICLTLTVFRQDFDARLIVLMGVLAMVKVFHWLIQDRINYMQTEPAITYMQHIRTASFLSILLVRVDWCISVHLQVNMIGSGNSIHPGAHSLTQCCRYWMGIISKQQPVLHLAVTRGT